MREWYETSTDLEAEAAIATNIAQLTTVLSEWLIENGLGFMTNVVMMKLPVCTYKVDWCVTNGSGAKGPDIKAWAELKRRKISWKKYSDIMISTHKMVSGKNLARETGVPFVVFIAFLDGLGFHVVDLENEYPMQYGGRTVATRDPADIEPVCYIQVENFWFLNRSGSESK